MNALQKELLNDFIIKYVAILQNFDIVIINSNSVFKDYLIKGISKTNKAIKPIAKV